MVITTLSQNPNGWEIFSPDLDPVRLDLIWLDKNKWIKTEIKDFFYFELKIPTVPKSLSFREEKTK